MSAANGMTWRQGWGQVALAGALIVLALPFGLYAAHLGLRGLGGDLAGISRFYRTDGGAINAAIFAHMALGGVLTVLVPLQLVGPLRRRWPRLHRTMGYGLIVTAALTGLGGLAYIAARGTIGGWVMDVGFAGYGAAMLGAAGMALRYARAGAYNRHRAWALRLFVLALGSWLYRVHYGIWELLTGGLGTAPDFSGPFDRVQVFAFYVPYLLALEWWLRRGSGPRVKKL